MTEQNKQIFDALLTKLLNLEFDCGAFDDPVIKQYKQRYQVVYKKRQAAKNALIEFVHSLPS